MLFLNLLTNNEFQASKSVTIIWIVSLPIIIIICHLSVSYFLRKHHNDEDNILPRAAIIGGNHVGSRLAKELQNNPLMGKRFQIHKYLPLL